MPPQFCFAPFRCSGFAVYSLCLSDAQMQAFTFDIHSSCMVHVPSKHHTKSFFPIISPFSGQALDLLVLLSSMHCYTSTRSLSTSSSSRGLTLTMGYLILRGASRLDAFSVYPCQTWLPCSELGSSTGTPAVCPSRSSRTKDSSSQISYAHAG